MNNHTASLEITVNVHESVLSRKLVFWTSNWKHVIKYDLYVKFPRIFAHNVQINDKFCCKSFNDVCCIDAPVRVTTLDFHQDSWRHKLDDLAQWASYKTDGRTDTEQ